MIRHLDNILLDHIGNYKEILILLGARQVGKTTILKRLFPSAVYLTTDNQSTREILERYDISAYKELFPPGIAILIIDEIHLLSDPGRAAKIIFDQVTKTKLIVTGSSSLHIKHKTTESLAGRKIDYQLFPLTIAEYLTQKETVKKLFFPVFPTLEETRRNKKIYPFDAGAIIDNVLVYGLYPAVITHPNKEIYLKNLADSVIFKDLLDLKLFENKKPASELLKLLAFQIGSPVNYSQIANKIQMDFKTVKKYISIFEKSYIIFSITPYSKNPTLEISKMPKIYFYDLGLRNALIDDFRSVNNRADTGLMFENFVIAELYKVNYYGNFEFKFHYWRTKQGSEIDLVLENREKLFGVEIKSSPGQRANSAFKNRYPKAKVTTLTKLNFL